ncbi:MAG: ABC transporter ATP-binding protein [Candidatus Flexifilum sp.]
MAASDRQIDHLEMRGIVKRFPGVLAVDHLDFDVRAGEIHALLGENGAGKSTLMKMLYGLYQPDEGSIVINGRETRIRSPQDAIRQGIGMVHQHFMLVPALTVTENTALGLPSGWRLDLKTVAAGLAELSEKYNLKVNPHLPIWQLSVGEQQRVEILRALYRGADLLILDEPTAVLTPQEVDELFRVLQRMIADGRSIIFISHKLHEVLALSHRITVLRAGRRVDTIPTASATRPLLAEMMVGRPVVFEYDKAPARTTGARLRLERVSALSDRGEPGLREVSLIVHGGEIVGVAGVSGNGQSELAQVIAGLRPVTAGAIFLDDVEITRHSPRQRHEAGIAYIPEERMADGAIKEMTVAENYILQDHGRAPFTRAGILLDRRAIRRACERAIRAYEIKTPSTETPIKSLSGGNIQKLILARELARSPRLLIAAQPTRGVDVGATEYIHRRLLQERASGTAILLISEDLDEIFTLADRIAVMYEGRIVGIVPCEQATPRQIGQMMAGVVDAAERAPA